MAAAAQACAAPKRNMRLHLDVYFRDSLTLWPWRQQQSAQQQQDTETQKKSSATAADAALAAALLSEPEASSINEMAKANVVEAMKRLPIIAPIASSAKSANEQPTAAAQKGSGSGSGENDAQQLQSVQKGVIHLVEAALNPKNLARMDALWMPWY